MGQYRLLSALFFVIYFAIGALARVVRWGLGARVGGPHKSIGDEARARTGTIVPFFFSG
jgi:hypothetical protein